MDESPNLSQSVQDYLKAIYALTRQKATTSTSEVAEYLGFSAASVTNMLQKLAGMQPSLVEYHKRQSVCLSEAGEQAALRILRRHRLLETFLVKVLNYTWDEVHEEADRLEHTITGRFEERLAQFLQHPEFDPHGDPIPNQDLEMPVVQQAAVSELRVGQGGLVRRVRTSVPEVLRHLADMGIFPGAHLTLQAVDAIEPLYNVQIGRSAGTCVLGPQLAAMIEVEVIDIL